MGDIPWGDGYALLIDGKLPDGAVRAPSRRSTGHQALGAFDACRCRGHGPRHRGRAVTRPPTGPAPKSRAVFGNCATQCNSTSKNHATRRSPRRARRGCSPPARPAGPVDLSFAATRLKPTCKARDFREASLLGIATRRTLARSRRCRRRHHPVELPGAPDQSAKQASPAMRVTPSFLPAPDVVRSRLPTGRRCQHRHPVTLWGAVGQRPSVGHDSFTGSTATGCAVIRRCRATIKSVFLELRRRSTLDDARLQLLASGIGVLGFVCTPGRCAPPAGGCHGAVMKRRLPSRQPPCRRSGPSSISNRLRPLISARQRDRVQGLADLAVTEGGRLHAVARGRWIERSVLHRAHGHRRLTNDARVFRPRGDSTGTTVIAHDGTMMRCASPTTPRHMACRAPYGATRAARIARGCG